MKKVIFIAVLALLTLLVLRNFQDIKETAVLDSAPTASDAGVLDEGLSLIVDGESFVEGGMGVNEFTLRHRSVQINPACLNHGLFVEEGDLIEFTPFEDVVIRGVIQHIQAAENALSFTVVVDGVPKTHIDVTIFNGRISIRYDRIDDDKRYLLVRTRDAADYFALEIDSHAEGVSKKEKAREEVELVKAGAENQVVQHKNHEVIPDAPGGRTMFGGEGFAIEQLPECRFKRALLALDATAKSVAVATLSEPDFQFHKHDLQDLYVDRKGGVNYACSFFPELEAPEEEAEEDEPGIADAPVPVSSPPIRHSKPGAAKVLFLDFNGHYMAAGETYWVNSTYSEWHATRGGESVDPPPWDCLAWSDDADRTEFNDDEQAYIIEVWARVSEDYAAFDVDVTTEFPGSWGPSVGHCLFTPTTDGLGNDLPHLATGGRAYVNVFGNSSYSYDYSGQARSPAFIATSGSRSYYYAEAASHELGHNLGLSHDGDSSEEYYRGHVIVSGDSHTWNPIMGGGVTPDVSQWSKGEYYDSSQSQDDLSVLDGKLSYRSDDHGDTQGAASALNLQGDQVTISDSGVIETTDDPDVFSFVTGSGEIVLSASTYKRTSSDWGSNLDIKLELRDEAGLLVASNNSLTDVNASITTTVTQGSYYLSVKPTGVSNPTGNPPYGYTSYGSLGFYSLAGTLTPSTGVTLSSPNAGASWIVGFENDITWFYDTNLTGAVSLELLQNGSLDHVIASITANDGLYTWAVPESQVLADDYAVRITYLSDTNYQDESSLFTIGSWFPYSESFEDGFGLWGQDAGEDFDWTRNSGTTVSSLTGPSDAQEGAYYLYTEASSPNFPSKTANLEADMPFNLLENPDISFAYHMYGSSMGTLSFDVSTNSGSSWNTEWSLSGDQGDQWFQTNVSLSAYVGIPVRLRFHGVTGSGYASDMAVDSIVISKGTGSPAIVINPTNLSLSATSGTTGTVSMVISNTGGSGLDFEISAEAEPGNYTYLDSDDVDGPTYSWIDITSIGTEVSISDDGESSLINIGFDFPFYDVDYTQFQIGANGVVSFSAGQVGVSIAQLPSTGIPSQSLAPLWDDLNPDAGGSIFYHSTAERLVVSWQAVPFYNTSSYQTFQTILYSDGRIVYQYNDVNGTLSTCAVGLQNDSTTGSVVNVAYNESYLKNALAIEFNPPGIKWLSWVPDSGTILADSSTSILFSADASTLSVGTYTTAVIVAHNDPKLADFNIPVILTVSVPDTDTDGLPDWWETQYFGGATNADASATSSNGVNTILEAYVAGLNPTNPTSLFVMTQLGSDAGDIDRAVLHWGMVSGRVYTIYWTSNLLSGFPAQPLTNNIAVGVFTDTVHGAVNDGFYRIEVDLAP